MWSRRIATLSIAFVVARPAAAAPTCAIVSTSGISFGAYDVFAVAPVDSAGSIVFHCQDVGPSDSVTIDLTTGNASGFFPRQLRNGPQALAYNLYLDAARSAVWGDGTSGTSQYGPVHPDNGTDMTITVYGRIPAGQNVSAGSYGDAILVTLNY